MLSMHHKWTDVEKNLPSGLTCQDLHGVRKFHSEEKFLCC